MTTREALILACSNAKRDPRTLPHTTEPIYRHDGGLVHDDTDAAKAPAVLVYNSPQWQIVRRWNPALRVFALSGKYGLFDARLPIPLYDNKMPEDPDHTWLYYYVFFGAKHLFKPYNAVWLCVPGGGYRRAVGYLADTLRAGGHTGRIAEITLRLDPADWTLPAHFARTKALSQLCKAHARGRMPKTETMEEWAGLVLAGEILA